MPWSSSSCVAASWNGGGDGDGGGAYGGGGGACGACSCGAWLWPRCFLLGVWWCQVCGSKSFACVCAWGASSFGKRGRRERGRCD